MTDNTEIILKSIKENQRLTTNSINNAKEEIILMIQQTNKRVDVMEKEINTLKEENIKLTQGIEHRDKKLEKLEKLAIANNLIIYGLTEEATEPKNILCETLIETISTKLEVDIKQEDIQVVQRIGKKNNRRSRPVKVTLLSANKKREIMKQRKLLKNTVIYIDEEYTRAELELRNKLKFHLADAKSSGNKAHIQGTFLVVNGAKYYLNQLETKECEKENNLGGMSRRLSQSNPSISTPHIADNCPQSVIEQAHDAVNPETNQGNTETEDKNKKTKEQKEIQQTSQNEKTNKNNTGNSKQGKIEGPMDRHLRSRPITTPRRTKN